MATVRGPAGQVGRWNSEKDGETVEVQMKGFVADSRALRVCL